MVDCCFYGLLFLRILTLKLTVVYTDKARVKRVALSLRKVETKLYCHFVAFALRPLNSFNTTFQTSASKIGTLQEDVRNLLRGFLSNFIQPELLAATPNDGIHSIDFENIANQLSNDELGIGSAARLLLIGNSDELEGTQEEQNFFQFVRKYNSTCDIDAVLMEFREYKSLPESQLPVCNDSLEQFWTSMGEILLPTGEATAKRFGNLAKFCKTLLVLPHSTADPERFSMIGKVDTSQRSNLHPSTVYDILRVKFNTDLECYKSKELFTPNLLCHAKTATKRCLSNE